MAIVTGLFQRIQVTQAARIASKTVSGTLAPALAHSTSRFHHAAANRPTSIRHGPAVHSSGVPGKWKFLPFLNLLEQSTPSILSPVHRNLASFAFICQTVRA
jgi:hypothetical protein